MPRLMSTRGTVSASGSSLLNRAFIPSNADCNMRALTLTLILLFSGCLCCNPTMPGAESGGLGIGLSGGAYRCTYTQGTSRSDYWVKGEKYYAELETVGTTTYVMSDGTWAYTWGGTGGKGMKFRLEGAQKQSGSQPGYVDVASIRNNARIKCEPEAIADSRFTPPSNVEFQDMQELADGQSGNDKPPTTVKNTDNNPFSGLDCSTCDLVVDPAAKRDCARHCTTD